MTLQDGERSDMHKIEIYTRPGCGYCSHAKKLLTSKGLTFTEYDVYQQANKLTEMLSRTSGKTFPQVFINQVPIGGFEELLKWEQQNKLPKAEHSLSI